MRASEHSDGVERQDLREVRTEKAPRVWNKRRKDAPPDAVYVGRPTAFGNPYMLRREDDRSVVLQQYRDYLARNPALVTRVKRELRGKDLVCWCAPKACHADVLLEIANAD